MPLLSFHKTNILSESAIMEPLLTTKVRYAKALSFRQALEALDPRPSDEALGKAAELYQHLVRTNRIYSYFDPRFDPALVDESGCIPEFNPGVIFNAKMETGPSPVPLFLKLFRRQHVSKECVICSGRRFEIDHTDVGTWKAECEPFKGTWMWDILVFPTSEVQHCDHDFNVCRSCTAKYIRSILTSGGADACEALSCPQCQRQLTYQEVMQLADAETATRYDLILRPSLSLITLIAGTRNSYCEIGSRKTRTSVSVLVAHARTASCTELHPEIQGFPVRRVVSGCVSIIKPRGMRD